MHWLHGDKKDKDKDKDRSGNSVPVNGGVVFLVVAGLGLGAKMLYDSNKKNETVPTSI